MAFACPEHLLIGMESGGDNLESGLEFDAFSESGLGIAIRSVVLELEGLSGSFPAHLLYPPGVPPGDISAWVL